MTSSLIYCCCRPPVSTVMDGIAESVELSPLAVDLKWDEVCEQLTRLSIDGTLVESLEKEFAKYGHPFLHLAAEGGDSRIMNRILNCVTDSKDLYSLLDQTDKKGQNLLHATAAKCPNSISPLLGRLDQGLSLKLLSAYCGRSLTPILTAINYQNPKVVKDIVDHIKLEKDLVAHLKHADQNGQNILHCTAVRSPDCLKYILDRLERNTRLKMLSELCNNNETPLMAAIGCDNNKSVVQILESIAMPPMPRRSIQLTNYCLQLLLIPSKKHT